MRLTLSVLSLAILAGCGKPPAEAPKELGKLGLFLFANFDAEDPAEMNAGIENLVGFIQKDDLTLDAVDLAVTMPILDGKNLGGLSIPKGVSAEDQIPVAMSGESKHNLQKNAELALEPNRVCIDSSTTIWSHREFLSDEQCWLDGDCETLQTLNEIRKENLFAKVWFDEYIDYRHFTLEDGTEVIGVKAWIEEQFPADKENNSWDQLYSVDFYIPNPKNEKKTLRWLSFWSSITVGGLGDDLYSALVREGIADAYTYGDEFIDGEIESCKNDRDLAKP